MSALEAPLPSSRRFVVHEHTVVVADPAMLALYALVESRLAAAELPVLLYGETGTGKELLASALHAWSPRRHAPLLALNCAALPEHLIESELFGSEKGAFSGADERRVGMFEAAHRGVLLLDEIGDLPLPGQAKLLRVLETRRVRPLGATVERPADVRIIAATHRVLEDEVVAGRFRRDLYFRLKGASLTVPPLRRRPADIAALAPVLIEAASARSGRVAPELTSAALERLIRHDWPGNVRELASWAEHAACLAGARVEAQHVDGWVGRAALTSMAAPPRASRPAGRVPAVFRPIAEELAELERSRMAAALAATDGHRARAAALISMPLRTFATKLKLYALGEP